MPLTARLTADVAPDAVTFEYTVENAGDDPVTVRFRSGKHADVTVSRDGEPVWRWSENRMFTQALQSVSFDPGARETFEFTWPDPDPGEYTATAALNATDVDATAVTEFSV